MVCRSPALFFSQYRQTKGKIPRRLPLSTKIAGRPAHFRPLLARFLTAN